MLTAGIPRERATSARSLEPCPTARSKPRPFAQRRSARVRPTSAPSFFVRVAPPAYTGLKAEEKPYAFKGVQALEGSEIRFRLQSNRPLREGTVEITAGDQPPKRFVVAALTTNGDTADTRFRGRRLDGGNRGIERGIVARGQFQDPNFIPRPTVGERRGVPDRQCVDPIIAFH